MSKPTDLPRWATDSGAPITEPTEGKKDVGWAVGEKPPAQVFNWWKNLVYQWAAYLNDGDLEGNHSIDGDLAVTGDVYHSDRRRTLPPPLAHSANATFTGATWNLGSGHKVFIPLAALQGDRVKEVTARVTHDVSAAWTLKVFNAGIQVGTTKTATESTVTLTVDDVNTTVASGTMLYAEIEATGGGQIFEEASVLFDRPAP